jgi:hypothetical protein
MGGKVAAGALSAPAFSNKAGVGAGVAGGGGAGGSDGGVALTAGLVPRRRAGARTGAGLGGTATAFAALDGRVFLAAEGLVATALVRGRAAWRAGASRAGGAVGGASGAAGGVVSRGATGVAAVMVSTLPVAAVLRRTGRADGVGVAGLAGVRRGREGAGAVGAGAVAATGFSVAAAAFLAGTTDRTGFGAAERVGDVSAV